MRLFAFLALALLVGTSALAQPSPRQRAESRLQRMSTAKMDVRPEGRALRANRPASRSAGGNVFVVNSTADTDDGECSPTDCTLTEALLDASFFEAPAEIQFRIGGGGSHRTIRLQEEFSAIDVPIVIDGDTQGCTDRENGPCITIDARALPDSTFDVFYVAGGDSELRNLHIVGPGYASLSDSSFFGGIDLVSSNNVVAGCVVGADRAGATPDPDGRPASGDELGFIFAVSAFPIDDDGVSGNRIGGPEPEDRNVIMGSVFGVELQGATETLVQNNVVSGHEYIAIDVTLESSDNVVVGNYVGLDKTGTVAVPNGNPDADYYAGIGIQIDNGGTGNRIGGMEPGDANVVSGNLWVGIALATFDYGEIDLYGDVTGNTVEGNYVGTDASGTVAIPNGTPGDPETGVGVVLVSEATVGAVTGNEVRFNVLSGNLAAGLLFDGELATGNVAEANLIGLGADFDAALPNGIAAVAARNGATGNRVGGEDGSNFLAYSPIGAAVFDTASLDVAENTFALVGQAIDLGVDGPSANDAGDADEGPSRMLNAPVIVGSSNAGGQLAVTVQLDAPPATATYPIRVTVYDAGADLDTGRQFFEPLGSGTITEAQAGQPVTITIDGGSEPERIAVAATDADGNTSEIGGALTAVAEEASPTRGAALRVVGANPFRAATEVEWEPATSGPARIAVVDALGREVSVVYDGDVAAGVPVRARIAGGALAPGVYVVQAATGAEHATRTIVRVR